MSAVGSRDGREIVRTLEALRAKGLLARDGEGRYVSKSPRAEPGRICSGPARVRARCWLVSSPGRDSVGRMPGLTVKVRACEIDLLVARTSLPHREGLFPKRFGIKVETEDLDTSAHVIALLARTSLQAGLKKKRKRTIND